MVSKEYSHLAFKAQFTIGIVGFGPKGLYALERLLAHLKTSSIKTPIAIHIFNQNHFFGAGNVYRSDQPPYLIMNYANENIDSWYRGRPDAIFPKPSNFCKWLSEKTDKPIEDFSKEFASRAMVGNYLMESFKILKRNAPSNVNIIPHLATVQKITKDNARFNLQGNKEGLDFSLAFDNLILTTGHVGSGSHFQPASNPSNVIEFIYPISQKLKHIEKQSNIAVKGFGLTAIDAILALTEGRGGIFDSDFKGDLYYKASGREPYKIFPFSRTGLPMFPRGVNRDDDSQLYFFSDEVFRNLQTITNLSFQEDILPIIKKEFRYSYYKILFRIYDQELKFDSNAAIIDQQIEQFHNTHSSEKRFFWKILTDPFTDQKNIPHAEMHAYIKFLIQEAEKGIEKSPIMAAAGIWRKISPIFNELYSFAGLDANSHQLFDTSFFGFFNRIAYGPPVKNMKKIIALAEAGIIDFSFVRNSKISNSTGNDQVDYILQNSQNSIDINYLINARIPRNNSRNYSELYTNLLKEGLVRPFTNNNSGFYNPGSFDIDSKGRAYARGGPIQENITMYGTPTEGVTFDNDTLSRKRNNFASHWAQDIAALLLKKEQKNRK